MSLVPTDVLAPGSVRNWASADDDLYIKQVKEELRASLQLRRESLVRGLSCNVGSHTTRAELDEWNHKHPNCAIPRTEFVRILERARRNQEEEEAAIRKIYEEPIAPGESFVAPHEWGG